MTVKELKKRVDMFLDMFSDDADVIIFVNEEDPFYLKASKTTEGYISKSVGQMFFNLEDFTKEDYEGVENFDGELETVFVIS